MPNRLTLSLALAAVLCLASTARSQNYTVSHLAGNPGGYGVADGVGTAARFSSPAGVAVHASGTIYVADAQNHAIRVVTPSGAVTTLAGSPGQSGYADGQGAAARFDTPAAIAVDADRTVFVLDANNRTIRMVTPAGVVSTLAGTPRVLPEIVDGAGAAARFYEPRGLALGPDGTLLVTDRGVVRRLTRQGTVTTVAGAIGHLGSVDGVGNEARFAFPQGVAIGPDGVAYVSDINAKVIRKITADYVVTTIAGWPGLADIVDGTGLAARFYHPSAITIGAGGLIYVTDEATIRAVTPDGAVTTVAGVGHVAGVADGPGRDARFFSPLGIAAGPAGHLYVSDNNTLRVIDPALRVTTLAGVAPLPRGYADGQGALARFDMLSALAVLPDGDMFVADLARPVIRRITRDGVVSTYAGNPDVPGLEDGDLQVARFYSVFALALGRDATLYVYDAHRVRAISPAGVVRTLAGAQLPGWVDGPGGAARFAAGHGNTIAVDDDGVVYVADTFNHVIRKVTADGVVTTWLGEPGQSGHADGVGRAARFAAPSGIAFDSAGRMLIAEFDGRVIRVATPDATVTTLAGTPGREGFDDGAGNEATFTAPGALGIDSNGNALVADAASVRRVSPSGRVTTILGDRYNFGSDDGTGRAAHFYCSALAMAPDGALLLLDTGNNAIRRGVPTRFLAEGASGATFQTRIALFNPGPFGTDATMTFQRARLAPVTQVLPVPAGRRVTVDAATLTGLASAEFSTSIDAAQPLVVDRTVTWAGASAYGAHAETAVRAPSLTWYLAEGATHSGMQLFYLLQNPNASSSTVRVRFLRPVGAPIEKTYRLDPQSRTNIWVNVEEFPGLGTALASTDVSAVFEVLNDQPIIVERALYLDVPGQFFGAGHESMGVTAPAREWFLAEGATGSFFDLFVLIANPGDIEAQVEATFLLPSGETVVKPYTIAANSRFNIWVDYADARLADTAVSTTIRSLNDVPIIVERSLWWPEGGWYEAHNTPGATTTGTAWAVAEGELDGARGLETYLLVANTSPIPAAVKVTLSFEDGTTATQTFTGIAARSRFNVSVGVQFAQAAGKRFSAIVESLGDTPAQIVVERAMYWNAAGQVWAAGTNALATKVR